jgi:hypothetical protein
VNRSLFRTVALVFGLLFVAAGVGAATSLSGPAAAESRALQLGVYDDSEVFGHPSRAFPQLKQLHAQVLRANLRWGGVPLSVANKRPESPGDPADPAYNWSPFDEMVKRAADANVKVVATIVSTPRWANGGKARWYPPKKMTDLRAFAAAAAKRYSGDYVPGGADEPLPAIRHWLAWNEPNNPVFLRPQWKRVRGAWRPQSPFDYAKICSAIWAGVHSTGLANEKVGCGVTGPRGNDAPASSRASTSPLVFLTWLRRAGLKRFDAYAHHPYYGSKLEKPTTVPKSTKAVTLGNISVLLRQLKRLYGNKRLWITEYGYQTRPPDRFFGVSYSLQAKYVHQAYALARKTRKVDMFVWFLIRDERRLSGWQSGVVTTSGRRKPAYRAFQTLKR